MGLFLYMDKLKVLPQLFWDKLETLVGISKNTCPCYTIEPTDIVKVALINNSISGRYIDEDEGLNNAILLQKEKCGQGSMWENLLDSRQIAITQIIKDIATTFISQFQPSLNSGVTLGQAGYIQALTKTGVQSIFLRTNRLLGGVISITHIGFLAKFRNGFTSDTVNIKVRRVGDTTDLYNFNYRVIKLDYFGIERVDTSLHTIPDIIKLPCDGSVYEIYYDATALNVDVYDNALRCMTCNNFSPIIQKVFSTYPDGYANGLILNCHFGCDDRFLTLGLLESNETVKSIIQDLIIFKTLETVFRKKQANNQIGATTDNITGNNNNEHFIKMYSALYNDRLSFLIDNYPLAELKKAVTLNYQDANSHLFTYDEYLGCFDCRTGNNAKRVAFIL